MTGKGNLKPVLVTAFQPFLGRGKNGSSTVLRWLRKRWPAGFARSCILPVAWEAAPHLLRRKIERIQPRLVLCLGEGRPGRVAVEMIAHNEMHGTDEAGAAMACRVIEAGQPPRLASTFSIEPDLAGLLPVPLVRSEDAGRFLCNRVLWEALRSPAGRAGFIHLPPQEDAPDAAYAGAFGRFVLAGIMAVAGDSPRF